jgi:hypothetical protein
MRDFKRFMHACRAAVSDMRSCEISGYVSLRQPIKLRHTERLQRIAAKQLKASPRQP